MWRGILIGAAALLLSGGANAQVVVEQQSETGNLAKFIKGFNAVNVRIQPESQRCGIHDTAYYGDKVKQELVALQTDALVVHYVVRLVLTANAAYVTFSHDRDPQ